MSLEPGSILINRYRIEAILGEGGMGAVYRALDLETKQSCAVKEFRLKHLPTEQEVKLKGQAKTERGGQSKEDIVTREKALAQFKREANLLEGLQHANLPKVTDYFPVGEDYYLVMTLIEGKNAATLLASMEGKPLPERAVTVWVKQVMDALIYCHSRGVIHRDIKPANIILTVSGTVYLVDFGIAKEENPTKETSIGARVITPGYSPPEQYSLGRTDARSDVYSLGATMYAMLTGKEPIDSINRLMGIEMPDIQKVSAEVSPNMMMSVRKAIALKPEERFQTMKDMQNAVFSGKASTRLMENAQTKMSEDISKTITSAAASDKAIPEWKSKITENSTGFQTLFNVKASSLDRLTFNIYDSIQHILWSPRGQYAAISTLGGVYLYHNNEVKYVTHDLSGWLSNYQLAFSSDESLLAVGSGINIQVWNIKSRQKMRDLSIDDTYQVLGLFFMPHGALIVAASSLTGGSLKIWDMQSKREMLSLDEEGRMIGSVAFSNTGKLVAIGWMGAAIETKKDGIIKVWNLSARIDMGTHAVIGSVISCMDFSADEKLIAVGTAQALHKKNLRIIKLPLIKGLLFDQDHASWVTRTVFSPDGKLLASTGDDGTIKIWQIEAKSEILVGSVDGIRNVSTASFMPDGKMISLGTSDGDFYIKKIS